MFYLFWCRVFTRGFLVSSFLSMGFVGFLYGVYSCFLFFFLGFWFVFLGFHSVLELWGSLGLWEF